MNIKDLKNKYLNSSSDSILIEGLELSARLRFIPEKQFDGELIILEDQTSTLEAVAKEKIFNQLKNSKGNTLKLKGRLSKTEYENLSFYIEEIMDV